MSFKDDPNYYDILDLLPDASQKDIQDAYLRTKSAFNKDSVALYSLVSPDERQEVMSNIEQAYQILSNPERRREYDQCHGLLSLEGQVSTVAPATETPNMSDSVVSIDRVPPMEELTSNDDLLVPPTTDFSAPSPGLSSPKYAPTMAPLTTPTPPPTGRGMTPNTFAPGASLQEEIGREIEWRGELLKRIRESHQISIEEMSGITKISKTYLQAIENENFPRLPAAVYLRGFVTQIAKILKLPPEKVAPAYLARYYQARPDQHR